MSNPTDHYVLLDRSDPFGAKWVLAVRVDRAGWRSASQRIPGTIPAQLDEIGQPVADEQARLVLWITVALDRMIVLRPLPGGGHVYNVARVDEEEAER